MHRGECFLVLLTQLHCQNDCMHDDQLIGYLLGALEPHEMLAVERSLRENPALRARLEQLEAMLEPLEHDREAFEPSEDLREKTLQAIDAALAAEEEAMMEPSASASQVMRNTKSSGVAEWLGTTGAELRSKEHSWWDFAFSVAAFAAVLALLLPALYQTRESARMVACQDNLRELGHMLTRFALADEDQRIPALEKSGREAFAGMYAVRLKGSGLLDNDPLVWCPGNLSGELLEEPLPEVPGPQALASADAERLALWQRLVGVVTHTIWAFSITIVIRHQEFPGEPISLGCQTFRKPTVKVFILGSLMCCMKMAMSGDSPGT